MVVFKALNALTTAAMHLQDAMRDKVVTVGEVYKIVDDVMRNVAGFGLDDIGLAVKTDEKGRTKIELVINHSQSQE
jgi:hypothetical protein